MEDISNDLMNDMSHITIALEYMKYEIFKEAFSMKSSIWNDPINDENSNLICLGLSNERYNILFTIAGEYGICVYQIFL